MYKQHGNHTEHLSIVAVTLSRAQTSWSDVLLSQSSINLQTESAHLNLNFSKKDTFSITSIHSNYFRDLADPFASVCHACIIYWIRQCYTLFRAISMWFELGEWRSFLIYMKCIDVGQWLCFSWHNGCSVLSSSVCVSQCWPSALILCPEQPNPPSAIPNTSLPVKSSIERLFVRSVVHSHPLVFKGKALVWQK